MPFRFRTVEEMFSDFKEHGARITSIVPSITNVVFDGPGQNEDLSELEQNNVNSADRYSFRTSHSTECRFATSLFA